MGKALWLGLALGACVVISVACSSDGSLAPADTSSPSSNPTPNGQTDGAIAADPPDAEAPTHVGDSELEYTPVDGPDAGPSLVCSSDAVVFDLTQLGPSGSLPTAFTQAWDYEVGNPVDTSRGPALVLAATGFASGPTDVRIGGVFFQNGNFTVPPAGAGTATVAVPYNATSKHSLIISRTPANFVITVGTSNDRRSIAVSAVSFTFEVDDACTELNGTLHLEIPGGQNGAVSFGNGTTLAEVLGPYTLDLDNDSVVDGWSVDFSSSRGSVTPVFLSP